MREIIYILLDFLGEFEGNKFDLEYLNRLAREESKLGVGFHYLIHQDGTVEVGRSEDEPSMVGLKEWKKEMNIISIALEGDKHTSESLDALTELLDLLQFKYPKAVVVTKEDF